MKKYEIYIDKESSLSNKEINQELSKTFKVLADYFNNNYRDDKDFTKSGIKNEKLGFGIIIK